MLVAWVDRGKREFKEVVLPALRALGCEYRVDDHLTKADPEDVVLAFGKPRLEKLQKSGVAPGNRAIQSLRGRQLGKPDQSKYLVTWDPTQCAFDSARKPEIEWDIRLAARLSETGSLFPQLGDYLQVDTFDAVVQALDGVDIGDPKLPIAIDLETLGTDYMDPEAFIVAISMTFEAGTSYVVVNPPESLSSQLDYIVNHPRAKVYGANFKFDMLWLREKWGIENFDAFVLDTTLVGSLLDENRSNSLNLHAKVYTDIGGYDDPFNEKYDKSRMDLIPVDDLVTYAGGDTDAGFRVAIRLRKDLMKRKRLRRFYQELLHPAMIAVTKMEHRGMCVDQQTYADLGYQLDQQMEKSLEEMREHMTGHLLHKYKDNPDPTRPVVIRDFLFNKRYLGLTPKILTEKTKEPSTAGEHFEMFADHKVAGPFIESLITYRQAQKTKSTYVDGFVKHLRSDGRFHPSYLLFRGQFHGDSQKDDDSGGRTGRTSVKEPAYQCQPANSRILTREGYRTMAKIHQSLRNGELVEVLSHDGTWRRAHTPYENGVQPVFRVFTDDGKYVDATGNHKLLTGSGWREVQNLQVNERVVTCDAQLPEFDRRAIRAADRPHPRWNNLARAVAMPMRLWQGSISAGRESEVWQHDKLRLQVGRGQTDTRSRYRKDPDLSFMGGYEIALPQPEGEGVPVLRWAWDQGVRAVDDVRELLGRYGRKAKGLFHRAQGRERGLRTGQLSVDSTRGSEQEQAQFKTASIVRIQQLGEDLTYGISVEGTHSYVSEGIVNHNTIPKHTVWAKPLRRAYVPPPGMVILDIDFSQGELRITACIADESTMIEVYRSGGDLHLKTGAQLNGIELAEALAMKEQGDPRIKTIRQGGKAGNFGLIYGMGAEGFVDYALKAYGVVLTLREAETFIDVFFDTYSGLRPWHETTKKIAHQRKHIESPLGRIRHLPLINSFANAVRSQAERQAVNAGVQATLTDMGLLALAELDARYPDLWAFGFTHDSLSFYVPEDNWMEWAVRIRDVMENLPLAKFDWHPQLQFPVEVELGVNNLADTEEITLAA